MSAIISLCGQYRYRLSRPGDNPLVFCMLNPSTADAELDDPTIRRCKSFSAANGFSGIIVVNLFAYRTKSPKVLADAGHPIGPDNDSHIADVLKTHNTVVAAWGANAPDWRVNQLMDLTTMFGTNLVCLGITKDAQPRHPLYVPGGQTLIKFTGNRA